MNSYYRSCWRFKNADFFRIENFVKRVHEISLNIVWLKRKLIITLNFIIIVIIVVVGVVIHCLMLICA